MTASAILNDGFVRTVAIPHVTDFPILILARIRKSGNRFFDKKCAMRQSSEFRDGLGRNPIAIGLTQFAAPPNRMPTYDALWHFFANRNASQNEQ